MDASEETTSWLYLQTLVTQLMLACGEGGRVEGEIRGGTGPNGRIRVRVAKTNRWPWVGNGLVEGTVVVPADTE